MPWFYSEVALVFLAILLAGIGTYVLTGRFLASDFSLAKELAKESPEFLEGVRCLLSLVLMVLAWILTSVLFFPSSDGGDKTHVRGRRLISFKRAERISLRLIRNDASPLFFGGLWLPSWAAVMHFLVLGTTGSGKTLTLRLLMQSVLKSILPGSDRRALVYDAKGDILSILHGMGLSCPIKTLNPFDRRCVAWDIAKDCTSPATALEIATILIPQEEGQNRFFSDAARHLIYGVLVAFIKTAPNRFTFRDVVLAVQSEKALRALLSRCPETQHLVKRYLDGNAREWSSILSSIATRMAPFEIIAAAWSRAEESVSLQDWVRGSYILVLGNDESIRAALDAINQVIFKRISELLLALPDSDTRRSWLFYDEAGEAGELNGLSRVSTNGRSKGVCLVLGLQDVEGFRDVYGEEIANSILGQCSHMAILRVKSDGTARWASQSVGELERYEYHDSYTKGDHGGSKTTTEQLVKREAVLPSEFMCLPATNPENGLSGFYLSPEIGAYRTVLSGEFLAESLLLRNMQVPDVVPRPVEDQYLKPWTDEDLCRLGLSDPDLPPDDLDVVEPKPQHPPEAPPRLKIVKKKEDDE
jgi:hypothetical protein